MKTAACVILDPGIAGSDATADRTQIQAAGAVFRHGNRRQGTNLNFLLFITI
jgi:hypothetical protein